MPGGRHGERGGGGLDKFGSYLETSGSTQPIAVHALNYLLLLLVNFYNLNQ